MTKNFFNELRTIRQYVSCSNLSLYIIGMTLALLYIFYYLYLGNVLEGFKDPVLLFPEGEIGNLKIKNIQGPHTFKTKKICVGKTCFNEKQMKKIKNSINNKKEKYIQHGDTITLRSHSTNNRLENDKSKGRFVNRHRGNKSKFYIENCDHPGVKDKNKCR